MSKIILASKSKARREMLTNAAVEFESIPADLDEKFILKKMQDDDVNVGGIALKLAQEKAIYISKKYPDRYIIGSDQVLSMNDKIYNKAESVSEAKERLLEFQGNEHFLTSAVCVAKAGQDLWHKIDTAALKMKKLDAQDIDKYSKIAGDALTQCVGCYALEGVGVRLFDDIRGDYFTILGMPLLPLLRYLDQEGAIS